jgi:hypothetical protein
MKRKRLREKFQNQNWTYRDFSNWDLQRANFKSINLVGANFTDVLAGIIPLVKVFIIVILLLLLTLAAIILSYSSRTIGDLLSNEKWFIAEFAWITLSIIGITVIIFLVKADFRSTLLFTTILFASFLIIVLFIVPENDSVVNLLNSLLAGFFILDLLQKKSML